MLLYANMTNHLRGNKSSAKRTARMRRRACQRKMKWAEEDFRPGWRPDAASDLPRVLRIALRVVCLRRTQIFCLVGNRLPRVAYPISDPDQYADRPEKGSYPRDLSG
jgi:hypothetical protein